MVIIGLVERLPRQPQINRTRGVRKAAQTWGCSTMGYSPSPIKRESVISQAAQEICRFIEAERLAAGDGLPPETKLSQMLGISRNSVREALRVLHGLGYVEK